jgi:dTDP-4-dehydrorhamnose 3,5-epimerase
VLYKCDSLYNKENEGGICYDDAFLNIDWKIEKGKEVVSDKDLQLPTFENCRNNFEFTGK